MAGRGGCFRCCCSFIFTSCLTALFLWLTLKASNPKCSIHKFYIPALDKTLNSTKNTTLYFQLKLANPNKAKGIYYDPLNLTFSDSTNRSHSLGNAIVSGFYQGHEKEALKGGNVDFGRAVSSNGSAVFRVDMVTKVRFKIMIWFKTKRHMIKVGADVQVNDQGSKVNSKDVKLKSMAPVIEGCGGGQLGILVNLFVLILLNLRRFG